MRFGNGIIQSLGMTLLVALLVIVPAVSGLALSSHSEQRNHPRTCLRI